MSAPPTLLTITATGEGKKRIVATVGPKEAAQMCDRERQKLALLAWAEQYDQAAADKIRGVSR